MFEKTTNWFVSRLFSTQIWQYINTIQTACWEILAKMFVACIRLVYRHSKHCRWNLYQHRIRWKHVWNVPVSALFEHNQLYSIEAANESLEQIYLYSTIDFWAEDEQIQKRSKRETNEFYKKHAEAICIWTGYICLEINQTMSTKMVWYHILEYALLELYVLVQTQRKRNPETM